MSIAIVYDVKTPLNQLHNMHKVKNRILMILELAHEILVLIAYAQRASNKCPYRARCLNFGLSLHLHPYLVCASSEVRVFASSCSTIPKSHILVNMHATFV